MTLEERVNHYRKRETAPTIFFPCHVFFNESSVTISHTICILDWDTVWQDRNFCLWHHKVGCQPMETTLFWRCVPGHKNAFCLKLRNNNLMIDLMKRCIGWQIIENSLIIRFNQILDNSFYTIFNIYDFTLWRCKRNKIDASWYGLVFHKLQFSL